MTGSWSPFRRRRSARTALLSSGTNGRFKHERHATDIVLYGLSLVEYSWPVSGRMADSTGTCSLQLCHTHVCTSNFSLSIFSAVNDSIDRLRGYIRSMILWLMYNASSCKLELGHRTEQVPNLNGVILNQQNRIERILFFPGSVYL